MRFKLVIILTVFCIISCQKQKDHTTPLLNYLPENASVILKINNLTNLKSELKNNEFIKPLSDVTNYDHVLGRINALEYVQSDTTGILAFMEIDSLKSEFFYVSDKPMTFVNPEKDTSPTIEPVTFEGRTYNRYEINQSTFFSIELDHQIILGSSLNSMDEIIRKSGNVEVDPTLKALLETSNSEKSASIYIKLDQSKWLDDYVLNTESEARFSSFADWVTFDIEPAQDHLQLNGITVANDSTKKFLNLFRNTKPLVSALSKKIPAKADAFLSFAFDNEEVFAENQQHYLESTFKRDSVFNTVEEIGLVFVEDKKIVMLSTYGAENITQFLETKSSTRAVYQGHETIELLNDQFLLDYFKPLIEEFKAKYYTILENTFVFTEDLEVLRGIIGDNNSGSTFDKSMLNETAQKVLADESSIIFIANSKGMEDILKVNCTKELLTDFKKTPASDYIFAGQIVADAKFFHSNLIIQKKHKEKERNTISPLFRVELDNDLATNPQFVKNHRTNKKEIVVQDQENNLYLISTKGKILWKKQLKGRVQGKISQVDLYKNGRLQLAFTTGNEFLILDRNGKEVKPFTMDFPGGNLNELAVFDYENKRNYRFVVTQGSKVYMYNSKGKIVRGFKYTDTGSAVLSAPKHIRIGNKDYLIFMLENGDLKILNRVGNTRVRVAEKIDFSSNQTYLYKNNFIVTDKKGTLFSIDTKGKITKTKFNYSEDHGLDATSKTLVTNNENILSIKGKDVSLDLGVYTHPAIFYVHDKIYVSVTDIQSQKVYLFDSNAIPFKNFPIYGYSMIDLDDIDNDRKIEFVCKDQENVLVLYKIN
ncbi:ribonuclease HII [uncultured Eudoraea sp.]|uniref:ribonuclease HII n=1 Tax=uncultured Eudoraea sp. TaxID=1035614 RepID=UPI0026292B4F|nr:ribonuclease HII [uncultured Eudoraea sp.]